MLTRKIIVLLLLVLGAGLATADQNHDDPLQLVRETADRVLEEVTTHKALLEEDSSRIFELVNRHVIPHFDFKRMTRSAMGKYWRRASDEQKAAITAEFRTMLIRTYGVALLNYSGEKIEYLPLRESEYENRSTVQTRVKEGDGGPKIPVDYRLFFSDDAWKVYDVVIDGVSLVSNYRTSFSGQIRRNGIDGLVKQLVNQNKDQADGSG